MSWGIRVHTTLTLMTEQAPNGMTMTTWFTSDTHFSHKNIIKYCDRPFADVHEMNEAIIDNWNSVVSADDTVFHLGDVAMGPIAESLPLVSRLNGYKILVCGNHDRPFMNRKDPAKMHHWWGEYGKHFQEVLSWSGTTFEHMNVSHFPYVGDSQEESRYDEFRMEDRGAKIVHGHVHTKDVVTYTSKGTMQVHVGMDAWNYTPVSFETIKEIING